ncbi:MAG: 16S rRNA (cytosine(1402)-N(4))-methyltransferase RsmH [Symbiobacteriaceae bacterium]|nr:16S rRNA (cytosine(1402)-N(4))-methyltransferase RsmH [Symbiobacteriaceae bacterium]
MTDEVVASLAAQHPGLYLDCTLGGGGHSRAILTTCKDCHVIGVDRDPAAIAAARLYLDDYRQAITLVKGNFRDLDVIVRELFPTMTNPLLDGIVFDLGVSSPQLDDESRGFSYWGSHELDMRMDSTQQLTAAIILSEASEDELTRIILEYGEERWASRIASFIIKAREHTRIETVDQLVHIISDAIPAAARRQGGHPARRTFQALRIAVNDELGALQEALPKATEMLKPGGKMVVISFHSLEDRLVKAFFSEAANPCKCPPRYPCVCGLKPILKLYNPKVVYASSQEILKNPRARSAKLRVAQRI